MERHSLPAGKSVKSPSLLDAMPRDMPPSNSAAKRLSLRIVRPNLFRLGSNEAIAQGPAGDLHRYLLTGAIVCAYALVRGPALLNMFDA